MNEDRGHERRRQEIGRRLDRDREFSGNTPLTDAERDAYIDRQYWREQAEAARKEAHELRCQKVYDTAASGIIAGTIGGVTVAAFVGMAKWIGVHFARFFGTG